MLGRGANADASVLTNPIEESRARTVTTGSGLDAAPQITKLECLLPSVTFVQELILKKFTALQKLLRDLPTKNVRVVGRSILSTRNVGSGKPNADESR